MNFNEIFRAHSIAEETITAILADMKANGIFTTSHENMDIRYPKLKSEHEGQGKQLQEALATIETLKKTTKGQEDAQKVISEHQAREQALMAELEKTKLEAAIKVELLQSKAKDVDYLTFKLNEKMKKDGETLTLDDSGAIKGWEDKLNGLKTQFPAMFESGEGNDGGYQVLEANRLIKGDGGEVAPTKETFKAMDYEARVALKKKNEQLYKQLRNQ